MFTIDGDVHWNSYEKRVWGFPKTLKIEVTYSLTTSLLGIYSKEIKPGSQKEIDTPIFIAALFIIVKVGKQPKFLQIEKQI